MNRTLSTRCSHCSPFHHSSSGSACVFGRVGIHCALILVQSGLDGAGRLGGLFFSSSWTGTGCWHHAGWCRKAEQKRNEKILDPKRDVNICVKMILESLHIFRSFFYIYKYIYIVRYSLIYLFTNGQSFFCFLYHLNVFLLPFLVSIPPSCWWKREDVEVGEIQLPVINQKVPGRKTCSTMNLSPAPMFLLVSLFTGQD